MKQHSKIFLLLLLIPFLAHSQVNVKDSSIAFPFLKFSYAAQLPGGDLAKRFGWNSNVGGNFSFKTKSNWLFGANGGFIFGNQVKENGILDSIETSTPNGPHTGFVINQNGNPEVVRLFERGFTISLHVGKIFNVFAPNKNSGIIFYGGPTYLRHKIRLYDVGNQASQLLGDYKFGYDRLSAGFGLHEFIGYCYFGNSRIVNFFAGFEFTEAITKSLRGYDYDLMQTDNAKRKDFLFAIRVGWILPLYKKVPQKFYYY